MLIQQLTEDNLITKEDVAVEIHSMHPSFLDH
jgi:aryl-alcohol dehydrogenase-like predicted oxidoreductase